MTEHSRSEIRLHGGGSRLKNPFAPRQNLIPTLGCVRMHNEDAEDLVDELRAGGVDGNDYAFIGSPEYLRIMAIFEPELRRVMDREQAMSRLLWQMLIVDANRRGEEVRERNMTNAEITIR